MMMLRPIVPCVAESGCDPDDMALIAAVSRGDRGVRRRLLKRVMPRVRKNVQYLSSGRSDVDDLVQLALLEILRSAPSFRGECRLEYWIDRITVRTSAKQFARRKRRTEIGERYMMVPSAVVAVDEQVALKEARSRLRVLFGELPEHLRVPVVLHYIHGYEVSEISDITETKLNTIRGRLRDGMKRLRKKVLADPILCEWIRQEE